MQTRPNQSVGDSIKWQEHFLQKKEPLKKAPPDLIIERKKSFFRRFRVWINDEGVFAKSIWTPHAVAALTSLLITAAAVVAAIAASAGTSSLAVDVRFPTTALVTGAAALPSKHADCLMGGVKLLVYWILSWFFFFWGTTNPSSRPRYLRKEVHKKQTDSIIPI